MKAMRVVCLLILFTLVTGASDQKVSNDCILPADISKVVERQFPNWQVKTKEDLELYHRQLWAKDEKDACPGIAIGHFIDLHQLDVALLLVPKSREQLGYKVIVFRNAVEGALAGPVSVEDTQGQPSERVVIFSVPPGQYRDAEGSRHIRIRRDGLVVEEMEAGASLYFWRADHFEHLIISE